MHPSLLLSRTALAGALVLGCADQQSTTAPADPPVPSFSAERGTAEFGVGFGDEKYSVFVGHTFEDVIGICQGTDFHVPTWDQLTVTRPEGRADFEASFKQLTRAKDLPLTIFEFSPFPFGHECDLLDAPRFEGTGRAFIEDNDVLLTHHGANASMVRVTGTVRDESGQEYHLVAGAHQVLSNESTFDNFIVLNFSVDVKLTPIGR